MYFDPCRNEWRYFKACSLPDQKSGCKLSAGLEVSVSDEYDSTLEALVLFVMKMTIIRHKGACSSKNCP